jgi:hypothetical protein
MIGRHVLARLAATLAIGALVLGAPLLPGLL